MTNVSSQSRTGSRLIWLGLGIAALLAGCAVVQTPYGPAFIPLGAVQQTAVVVPAAASGASAASAATVVVTPAPQVVYSYPYPTYYYGGTVVVRPYGWWAPRPWGGHWHRR